MIAVLVIACWLLAAVAVVCAVAAIEANWRADEAVARARADRDRTWHAGVAYGLSCGLTLDINSEAEDLWPVVTPGDIEWGQR